MWPNGLMPPSKYFFEYEATQRKETVFNISVPMMRSIYSILTLHEFGGTSNCVISPACTQNRCNNVPLYKSHKQTAKSTPPDNKCDLSYLKANKRRHSKWDCWLHLLSYSMKVVNYLGCANDGHSKQLTRPRCADKIWCAGHSTKMHQTKKFR